MHEGNSNNGWGVFSAFKNGKDTHGDSTRSFSVFTIFFALLALCGVGYYTYQGAFGAARINAVPVDIDLSNGLVAHWTFDTNTISGSTVTDMTYRGNDGTLVNAPATDIGRLGQGVSLNGASQYVSIGNKNIIENAPAASICLWVRYDPSSVTVDAGLVTKWSTEGWLIWIDDVAFNSGRTDTVSFSVDSGQSTNGRVEGSSNLITSGEWGHYCGTFQGGTFIRLYKNGVLDQENTTSVVSVVKSNTDPIRIGDSANGSSIKYLDGLIDDVRIYNRALSAQEVEALYELGERTKINTTQTEANLQTGLVGHWTFDGADMTTATATDVSENGNDGALTNGPQKTIGKTGQALSFDGGSSRVVSATNTVSLSSVAEATLSFWAYSEKESSYQGGIFSTLAGDGGGNGPFLRGFMVSGDSWGGTQKIRLVADGSSGDMQVRSAAVLPKDEWTHVTIVWDGSLTSAGVDFYFNGTLVGTESMVTGSGSFVSSDGNFVLGNITNLNYAFDGSIDDVRLYNRVLSADEIAQLYALGGGSKIKICREESVQDADANTYNTIAIGSQCWLDRNMNVGTRINAATAQTDNGTIEKYCYSDTDSNCTSNHPNKPDGGLYQWNEAMQYSTTEGVQGICPAGFHIPTDAEWHALEVFLTDSEQSCDPARSGGYACSPAGTKLYAGGSSRFEATLAGIVSSGSPTNRNTVGYFWTSTESGVTAYLRDLTGTATIRRVGSTKSNGASVRCIQDE